ncbi:tripartite tricarboxylate transporter permease [Desulfovibrio sp. OttesenSCG-928-O18]|nr:tripartite tricarboxylate transporter permease [Desulfovibrio sp. OttesenSCG-928-O18]
MEFWLQGLAGTLQWDVMLAVLIGVVSGTVIGAIPGLTGTMAIGLLIPFTFKMPMLVGMGLLLGVYVGSYSGGAFSSILLGIPGTPSNFVTTFDGYPMAKRGMAGKALVTAVFTSFIGGMFSAVVLSTVAPPLARLALDFGPPEYFAFALLGLTLVAGAAGDSLSKGLLAGGIGLFLSYIGTDPMTSLPRYTFGSVDLVRGIPLIPALIGLFALPPLLTEIRRLGEPAAKSVIEDFKIRFLEKNDLKRITPSLFTSAVIGTIVGIIPGTGSSIAAFISYDTAKSISKNPAEFGQGSIEGVTASECCNNATIGGALVPLMVLGIPGDAVTAVLLGGLMIQGLVPGPMLFTDNPAAVYGIFVVFFAANIFMFLFQYFSLRYYVYVTKIPLKFLVPLLLFLCCIGSYSISSSMFDVWVMIFIGLGGYMLSTMGFPLAPIVLGLVLGPILEANLRRSMLMLGGDATRFLHRPISAFCIVLCCLSIALFVYRKNKKKK